MKALVVGLGSIGRRHARNWAALGLGQVAICRQTDNRQPEPLGIDAVQYGDLDRALAEVRPEVVVVSNPTSLHVATACAAVRGGAHVLLEKPLGDSLHNVEDLLEVARRTGRQIAIAYNLRFHPGLQRLKQLEEQGAIGKILSARAEVGEYLPDWHPWEDYRRSYSGRRELGGGAILTSSHELDALCWLLGQPERLVAMSAHASTLEIDTEDTAEILLRFAGGAIGSVHVDYVRRAPSRAIELVGEDGILRWDYHRNRIEQFSAANHQWRVEEGNPRFERNDTYLAELRQFADLVGGGPPGPLASGEHGAAVLALLLAARRSSAESCAIDLAEEDRTIRGWLSSLNRQS
jgi:predicted dehydrogenase